MKYIYTILALFMFYGCSGQQMADNITKAQIAMSGNKPPAFFRIKNIYTMNHYVFNMEDYTISLPSAQQEDFSVFGGWQGVTHYNRDITLYLGTKELGYPYHIVVSTDTYEYTEREREIENGNVEYIRNMMRWVKPTDEFTIEHHGKEKYSCAMAKLFNRKGIEQRANYRCYKFNPEKTKARGVMISLTYTKIPTLQEKYKNLAKEYTYEDLINRAQRMLDSLYIKDGWDE